MRHEETRDNTTAIEATIIEADKLAREESAPYPPAYPFPVFGGEPDPAGVQLERRFGELPEVARKRIAREHDKIVAKARRESEERYKEHNDGANGYDDDPEDPEHDPIGDAATEYDIEFEEEPEDDGQPSEYEEWQDYFGGDEYYDHSENEIW